MFGWAERKTFSARSQLRSLVINAHHGKYYCMSFGREHD
jgi:hypothetical protein